MNKVHHSICSKVFISFIIFVIFTQSIYSQYTTTQVNYDVSFYHLDLTLNDTSTYLIGNAVILARILYTSDTLILNMGNQLLVNSVTINEAEVLFSHTNDKLMIISETLIRDSLVSISIYYEGEGSTGNNDGALYNKENKPYGKFTYSLSEPFSTKYWFPCKEVLSDKADSVYVYITVPNQLKVGSNGLLKEIVQVAKNNHQYRWESTYPTAFYLISVALGDYLDYTIFTNISNSEKPLPIVNYIYNSQEYLEEQKKNIDTTAYLINLFSDLFTPYPFPKEKYGHCIAPLGGGMEHQTMTTLANFGYNLVAHELAHQWFGNFVTCSSWNHIWINEGFASYAEYLAHEFSGDAEGAQDWIEYAQYSALNSTVGSIYIPENEIDNLQRIFNYNSTYKKGASIIHMLRYEINNDKLFFTILREFLQEFGYGVANASDFLKIANDLTGKSFDYFFNQWYYGAGYPIFDINWYQVGDTLIIKNFQTASEPAKTPLFDLKMQYRLVFPSSDTIVETEINNANSVAKFHINKQVFDLQADPDNFLLKKVNSITRIDSLMSGSVPHILLFPNPAYESVRFYLRGYYNLIDVSFYNMAGVKIKTVKNVNPTGFDISLAGLERGVYLVSVDLEMKTNAVKLIKS